MKRVWQRSATLLTGMLVTAMYAMPQAYTVSARPGAVNYIEGHVYVNGQPLADKGLRTTFLNANDTLSTEAGKAEILLTPGVFLRIGDNSAVRMISPALTSTQLEVKRGEAMIEADGLLKENNVQVIDHGASITIEKNGLYRFTADDNPTAAVIEGKAEVYAGNKKTDIGRGHEMLLADLKQEKFDRKKEDDLYAWSNVRSEYAAATSYQAAKSVTAGNYGAWGGYGFNPMYGSGWYWNSAFNGWGWLPGNGAFFSPFGWGFYGAGYLPYAPVVMAAVGGGHNGQWAGGGTTATVPVNPNHPPAVGIVTGSPYANQVARSAVAHSFASAGGFHTASGAPVGSFSGGHLAGFSGAHGGAASSGGFSHGDGFSGGGHAAGGGFSHGDGFSGGGHAGGGGGGGFSGGGGHAAGGGGGHAAGGVAHR